MKTNISLPRGKLQSLEEGTIRYEIDRENDNEISFLSRIRKHSSYDQFSRILKLFLLLELIFFIGWIGCIFLSNHIGYNYDNDYKPETSNFVKSFAMKHTPSANNNQLDFEDSVTAYRIRRNSNETELTPEICESRVNATRQKVKQLTKRFILGEDSDATVIMLREKCRQQIVAVTLRVMMAELISSVDSPGLSDEQWHTFAVAVKQGIRDGTSGEQVRNIQERGPPISEMVGELRTCIESMILDYKQCERILPIGGSKTTPSIADLLNERDKCETVRSTLKADIWALEVLIVPGDHSDRTIVRLRDSVENMTITLATSTVDDDMSSWPAPNVTDPNVYLSDEQLQNYIISMKENVMNSTDSEHRRQIEESGSSMHAMLDKLRSIVNNYINNFRNCNALRRTIHEIRKSVEEKPRTKREYELKSESETCWIDEPDKTLLIEQQSRHDDFKNYRSILEDGWLSLTLTNRYLGNAMLEIRNQFFYLLLDLMYEARKEWPDDLQSRVSNFTDKLNYSKKNFSSEEIFDVTVKLGQAINMHYEKLGNRTNEGDTMKPVYGKLVYDGDETETLGLRHIRHILNGIIRVYFKLHDPFSLMCKSDVEVQSDPILQPTKTETEMLTREKRSSYYPLAKVNTWWFLN